MKSQSLENEKIYKFVTIANQLRLQDTDQVVHSRVTTCQGQAKTCLRSETERTLTWTLQVLLKRFSPEEAKAGRHVQAPGTGILISEHWKQERNTEAASFHRRETY